LPPAAERRLPAAGCITLGGACPAGPQLPAGLGQRRRRPSLHPALPPPLPLAPPDPCPPLAAGHARGKGWLRLGGSLRYNGRAAEDFELQRTAAYVAQTDYHIPTLTVDETLSFAQTCLVRCRGCC
jgi:hypothetical protein